MKTEGYYQRPTIAGGQIVFTCEDDLWRVPVEGGVAERLTANTSRCSDPHFSPDGKLLAYTGRDEGHAEIYVMEIATGDTRRLTYLGGDTRCAGWDRKGTNVLYASNAGSPFGRVYQLGRVPVNGGIHERLPWGPAAYLSWAPRGKGRVLGRHTWDPARWKRYRGGTAGQLWVDREENGKFERLLELDGNLTRPLWVGKRIYFGSDHEGICNLYSCNPRGGDLKRHTDHHDFYLRYPSTDGQRVIYSCGADLFLYDPKTDENPKIDITFYSTRPQRVRKFVNSWHYLESYDAAPKGESLAAIVRGRPFAFHNWEGPVTQLGERDGVRYRLARWLDEERLLVVSDESGEEQLEVHPLKGEPYGIDADIGRVLLLEVSPDGLKVALTNHRHQLIVIFRESEDEVYEVWTVEENPHSRIGGIAWSPDSLHIAYSSNLNAQDAQIRIFSLETEESRPVTTAAFYDYGPSFDPEGRYLYFFSCRDFNPVYDNLFFELSFPEGARPYLVTLRQHLADPFDPLPRAPGDDPTLPKAKPDEEKSSDEGDEESPENGEEEQAEVGDDEETPKESSDKDDSKEVEPLVIDFEGIENRVLAFPVEEGRYGRIEGLSDQVLFSRYPVEGALSRKTSRAPAARGIVYSYDFKTQEHKEWVRSVSNFRLSRNRKTLAYRSGYRLRMVPANKKPSGSDTSASRKTGYIDVDRIKASINPALEWRQMFREAYRLMRDHFWDADMSRVDWDATYQQYLPILERVATRYEFSDLLWEFQGELGTSHAYEYGGDYPAGPYYVQGKLAADFRWDGKAQGYRVVHLPRGDSWDPKLDSPINQLGAQLKEGDHLLRVDGHRLDAKHPPQEFLVHRAGVPVTLEIRRQGKEEPEEVVVKTLRQETPVRYRYWVESNRQMVHRLSKGKVGYIHIPNMGADGFAEFHRGFYSEVNRDGLVVDVRYNGGGNVSQLLLEKLARRRLGFDVPRYGQPIPYPQESPAGALVALTNEQAGSDGDIFSHCFKLMGLGPLIGTRTWGGVIGIWPRHHLVDGTITTQPEFAFWFKDVGWKVENYGTDPDEVIDLAPHDWRAGNDPQLERAVELCLEQLKNDPPLSLSDSGRPVRARPQLPRRR